MSSPYTIVQRIREAVLLELKEADPTADVQVSRSSLGWVRLQIISDVFSNKDEDGREALINHALEPIELALGMYPFAGYDLRTPAEVSNMSSFSFVQLPLWSEILLAPDIPFAADDSVVSGEPLVVTFYSFKGGVGRSTALAIVAGLLEDRKRRVVMVDLDLEAPGLSVMVKPSEEVRVKYGVLDYVYQRWLTPSENMPRIEDCVHRVGRTDRELYLVPAGVYDENYIHRLGDFDVEKLYRQQRNPIRQLIQDLSDYLDPDVILLDARTGFDQMGAISLLDLADLGIICFSPSAQNYQGLTWVIKAALRQRRSQGKPDLRFVLTPMPPVDRDKRDEWIAVADEKIAELWGLDEYTSADEMRVVVDYQSVVPAIDDILSDVPEAVRVNYQPIADFIDAALPDFGASISMADARESILREISFEGATADRIETSDIPRIFQRTGDFPKFLQQRTTLIRGAKGTGKSLLFRLFVEQPVRATELARPHIDLAKVTFIGAHGRPELDEMILNSEDLDSFERRSSAGGWQSLWRAYALVRIAFILPDTPLPGDGILGEMQALLRRRPVSHSEVVDWLVKVAELPETGPILGDAFRSVNRWLKERNEVVWLLYDELDTGFGTNYERRRQALEALLAWWLEAADASSNIRPKCFVRQDIWRELNFPNKSHYSSRDLELRWQEEDLWRLVLRQALNSPSFALKIGEGFGLTKDNLENAELDRLRRMLHPFWGDRMGKGKKAYTHRWVLRRVADGQQNRFPRSLIVLLAEAVKNEKLLAPTLSDVVLRPRSLQDAMPRVSEKRVDEVRDEYPEFEGALHRLKDESSPLTIDRLADLWSGLGKSPEALVEDMVQAGILEKRRPSKLDEEARFAVAELYLSGLGMRRKGQR